MKKSRLKLEPHEALTEWQSGGFDLIDTDILKELRAKLDREIERRRREGEE